LSRSRAYTLTASLVAAHSGGPVVCLDARALGRSYRLHSRRPGAEMNGVLRRGEAGIIGPGGNPDPYEPEPLPSVIRVDIRGPLEQRAGWHDPCGGWSDGYDALAERMSEALVAGDVLLVIDSPGGSYAGLAECVRRINAVKARQGRRIIGYVDECAASAAYWIAACVCDEVYAPASALAGSIGVLSCWTGVAGALAKEGIDVRHFAYPPGKVALASERSLSEVGEARANRDIMLAFDAFATAIGDARGLSRDAIVALDADCLSGAAAVEAGLVDGVATLEETQAYALALASREKTMPDEDEKKKAEDEGEEPEAEETPDTPLDAEDEEPDPDAEDEDEPPPSSERPPMAGSKASARARSPRRSTAASYASIAGLREGSSDVAIKTALLGHADIAAHVSKLTGVSASDPQGIIGAIDALATDAAEAGRYKAKLAKVAGREAARERMDLLGKLAAAGIHTPGELYAHDDAGKVVRPSKLWGPGKAGRKLANLREYVRTRLENAGPAPRRDPFQPAAPTSAGVTEEDRRIAANTGKDPEKVARARAALFGNGAQGAHGSFR